ncbi:MAG: flagellar hook capping protein [Candidatus Marinimicrobia bacterium]|nr:flagellar hook capping protein [Candidatus Neomarinimicrobiota bacterium]|tara:strand:- start:22 stop:693 length:672 start_codon:yes stop_codon:yes gene_type:complete
MSDLAGISGITNQGVLDKNAAAKSKLAEDLDSFLLLLTQQLKGQDPLSPMDSSEFTNQLVQFAQVEQQIGVNENLTDLLGLTQQSIISDSVSYIGHTVEGVSSSVPMQDGHLKAAYGLTEDATSVSVVVRNDVGDIVYFEQGETLGGVHEFNWDGVDSQGNQLSDGTYSLSASATKNDGTPVDTYITAFGRVTGVTNVDGRTLLLLGQVGLPIDDVLSVSDGT